MKSIAIFIGLFATSSYATLIDRYQPDCGKEFQSVINKKKRDFQFLHSHQIQSNADLAFLSEIERRALDTYLRDELYRYFGKGRPQSLTINLARYLSKAELKTKGFRVEVLTPIPESRRARFYFSWSNNKANLLHVILDAPAKKSFWVCERYYQSRKSPQMRLAEIANAIGPGFNYHSSTYQDLISHLTFEELPAKVRRTIAKFIQAYALENHSTVLVEGSLQYAVSEENEILGYVKSLLITGRHEALQDSGVHLYLTKEGKVVKSLDWFSAP